MKIDVHRIEHLGLDRSRSYYLQYTSIFPNSTCGTILNTFKLSVNFDRLMHHNMRIE